MERAKSFISSLAETKGQSLFRPTSLEALNLSHRLFDSNSSVLCNETELADVKELSASVVQEILKWKRNGNKLSDLETQKKQREDSLSAQRDELVKARDELQFLQARRVNLYHSYLSVHQRVDIQADIASLHKMGCNECKQQSSTDNEHSNMRDDQEGVRVEDDEQQTKTSAEKKLEEVTRELEVLCQKNNELCSRIPELKNNIIQFKESEKDAFNTLVQGVEKFDLSMNAISNSDIDSQDDLLTPEIPPDLRQLLLCLRSDIRRDLNKVRALQVEEKVQSEQIGTVSSEINKLEEEIENGEQKNCDLRKEKWIFDENAKQIEDACNAVSINIDEVRSDNARLGDGIHKHTKLEQQLVEKARDAEQSAEELNLLIAEHERQTAILKEEILQLQSVTMVPWYRELFRCCRGN